MKDEQPRSSQTLVPLEKKQHPLTVLTNTSVADQLHALANQIQAGTIRQYEFKQTANTVTLTVDSADGNQRLIQKREVLPGLVREQSEYIEKLTPAERRETVKKLVREGLSQNEIARRTLMSQKTISNDIQRLKDDGEIKKDE